MQSTQKDGATPDVVQHHSSSGQGSRHRRISASRRPRTSHTASTSEASLVSPQTIHLPRSSVHSPLQLPFDQSMSPNARRRFLSLVIASCKPEELLFMSETIAPLLKRDFIYQLPQELVLHVLSFIDEPKDLMRASLVSKYWYRIIRDESIWKRMCFVYGFNDCEVEKRRFDREETRRCAEKGNSKQTQSDPLSDDDNGLLSADADEKEKKVHHHHHHRKFSFRRYFRDSFIIRMNWRTGGKLLKSHKLPIVHPDTGTATSISLDSEFIVVGFTNSMIKIFSVRTGVLCRTLVGHKSGVWCVCLVSQGGHRDPEPGHDPYPSMPLEETTLKPSLPSPQTRRSSTCSPPIVHGSSSGPPNRPSLPKTPKKSKEFNVKESSSTHSKKSTDYKENESSNAHSKKSASSNKKGKKKEKGRTTATGPSISEAESNLSIREGQGDVPVALVLDEKEKEEKRKRSTPKVSERISSLSLHATEGRETFTSPPPSTSNALSPQAPTPSGSKSARSATTLDLNERRGVNKIMPFQSQEHLISRSMQRMLGIEPQDSDKTSSGEGEETSSSSSSSEDLNTASIDIDERDREHRRAGKMRAHSARRPSHLHHHHHHDEQLYQEDDDELDSTNISLHAPGSSRGWGQPNPLIVSGGSDKTVHVWDAISGQCIYILNGHTSTIRAMRVLHNRPVAVTGSRDSTLRVWDIQLGRCLRVLEGHLSSVRCLDVHGNKVVSGSYDNTCRLWNIDTGECLHVLTGHYHQVYSVAFDGTRVVSGGLDTTVRVWDAETGHCVALLQGHTALVCEIQLSPTILATGGSDGRVITFSIDTYEVLYRLIPHESSVTSLQFDENFLVTGGNDGRVKLYETQTGEYIRDLTDASDSVWKVAFGKETLSIMCKRGSRTVVEIWNLGSKWRRRHHRHVMDGHDRHSRDAVDSKRGDGAASATS